MYMISQRATLPFTILLSIVLVLVLGFGAFLGGAFLGWPTAGLAQTESAVSNDPAAIESAMLGAGLLDVSYYRAKVTAIDQTENEYGIAQYTITAKIKSGDRVDELIEVYYYPPANPDDEYTFELGESIVVSRAELGPDNVSWTLNDRDRLSWIVIIAILFVILALILAGWKRGISALAGLTFSVMILVQFMIPQIAAGKNAVLIGLSGAIIISVISIYLAHGLYKRTSIAVVSTLVCILITMLAATAVTYLAQMYGTGSEEAYVLQQFSLLGDIDMRGLFLAGIVIGALGVLDDVTTSLTTAIEELKNVNATLGYKELLHSGLKIGREHITSLLNTLIMAYAGAAMPILLLFTIDQRPLWVLLNSQFIAEEIIRAIVGSTALMLAVPITAVLAAYVYKSQSTTSNKTSD